METISRAARVRDERLQRAAEVRADLEVAERAALGDRGVQRQQRAPVRLGGLGLDRPEQRRVERRDAGGERLGAREVAHLAGQAARVDEARAAARPRRGSAQRGVPASASGLA